MKKQLQANIWKYYVSGVLQSFWFLLPVFILYFQSFGISYTQLGLFETVGVIALIILEIPTGAVADLFGRKISVAIGVLICAVSNIIIALSSTVPLFIFSYILCMGSWLGVYIRSKHSTHIRHPKRFKERKRIPKNSGKIPSIHHFLPSIRPIHRTFALHLL